MFVYVKVMFGNIHFVLLSIFCGSRTAVWLLLLFFWLRCSYCRCRCYCCCCWCCCFHHGLTTLTISSANLSNQVTNQAAGVAVVVATVVATVIAALVATAVAGGSSCCCCCCCCCCCYKEAAKQTSKHSSEPFHHHQQHQHQQHQHQHEQSPSVLDLQHESSRVSNCMLVSCLFRLWFVVGMPTYCGTAVYDVLMTGCNMGTTSNQKPSYNVHHRYHHQRKYHHHCHHITNGAIIIIIITVTNILCIISNSVTGGLVKERV